MFHKLVRSGNNTAHNNTQAQALPYLCNSPVLEGPAQVDLKSKLQDTGSWLAAPWTHRRLCNRPAVPFNHLRLDAPSLPPRKFRRALLKLYFISLLFPNFLGLKLCNLKLGTSGMPVYNKIIITMAVLIINGSINHNSKQQLFTRLPSNVANRGFCLKRRRFWSVLWRYLDRISAEARTIIRFFRFSSGPADK